MAFDAIQAAEFCHYTQIELIDAFKNNTLPSRERTGLLSALLSTQNVSAQGETIPVDSNHDGRPTKVDVRFITPESMDDTTDTAATSTTGVCGDGNDVADLYQTVELTNVRGTRTIQMTDAQMRAMCEKTASERRVKIISGMMNSIVRNINADLIVEYVAGAGGFLNGVAGPKTIDIIDAGPPVAIIPGGEIEMIQDYEDAGALGKPIAVGGGNLYTYTKYAEIGCCNDAGQQLDQLGNFDFFYDNQLQSAIGASGANMFFLFSPGAAQFLSINYNVGDFRKSNDLFVHDVLTDPISGLTFDYYQKYDDCTKAWKFYMELRFGLWQPPLTMFKAADDRFEINYNFLYTSTSKMKCSRWNSLPAAFLTMS